jgi:hypothetical protein
MPKKTRVNNIRNLKPNEKLSEGITLATGEIQPPGNMLPTEFA